MKKISAWATIVAWLLLLGTLTGLAPALATVTTNGEAGPPADSRSVRAAALTVEHVGETSSPPAIIVITSSSAEITRAATTRIVDSVRVADLPVVRSVVPPHTPPAPTQTVLVATTGQPGDASFREGIGDLRSVVHAAVGTDTSVEAAVTGPAGIVTDAVAVFTGSDRTLLLGTIGLVVVLLFVIYRSPALVAVALAGIGVAMRLAETVGALLSEQGWMTISSQTASIMTVLIFGVGTDYALIIFSRLRESLAECADVSSAVAHAVRSVAGALAASVSTIVAAVLVLLAAVSPPLREFGPYLAVGVGSMAAVAFTLTPALLVVFGRFVLWPTTRRTTVEGHAPESRLWRRVAHLAVAAPRRVLLGGITVLLLCTAGLAGASQSFDLVSGFRVASESATGQQIIADELGPGIVAPSHVLVESTNPLTHEQTAAITTALTTVDGVARTGPVTTSPDGRFASVDVTFTDNPYGDVAMGRVPVLVDTARSAAIDAGVDVTDVVVGGETAEAADTRAGLDRDLFVVGALMLLAVGLILGLVLRSVLAPLYLVVALVASYAAAMGALSFVALTLGGDVGIGNRVAAYVLVFLVALGVDYTIFMMTRYRQELAHHEPTQALRVAVVRTGGMISSAGVILAGTFAVLMTQPIRELFQFGLGMAIGILLDTFVVRPLLVPSIIRLLGRHALWPTSPPHQSAVPPTGPTQEREIHADAALPLSRDLDRHRSGERALLPRVHEVS